MKEMADALDGAGSESRHAMPHLAAFLEDTPDRVEKTHARVIGKRELRSSGRRVESFQVRRKSGLLEHLFQSSPGDVSMPANRLLEEAAEASIVNVGKVQVANQSLDIGKASAIQPPSGQNGESFDGSADLVRSRMEKDLETVRPNLGVVASSTFRIGRGTDRGELEGIGDRSRQAHEAKRWQYRSRHLVCQIRQSTAKASIRKTVW